MVIRSTNMAGAPECEYVANYKNKRVKPTTTSITTITTATVKKQQYVN